VYEEMLAEGDNMTGYDRNNLMEIQYDNSELCHRADDKIRTFQADGSREAGIFHHLITLPTYHTTALHMNDLTQGYFEEGMLAYVRGSKTRNSQRCCMCKTSKNGRIESW
jgi:isocitrate lyase